MQRGFALLWILLLKQINNVSYETKRKGECLMEKRIYCGIEDFVDFFKQVVATLGIEVEYQVEDCDGELEIVIKGE